MSAETGDRNARIPFTREQLESATHVRTILGWYPVVQVERHTVVVTSLSSLADSVLVDKILEVRGVAGRTDPGACCPGQEPETEA